MRGILSLLAASFGLGSVDASSRNRLQAPLFSDFDGQELDFTVSRHAAYPNHQLR